MTALTAYLTTTAATTVTTSNQLSASAPAAASIITGTGDLTQNGTGFVELCSQAQSTFTQTPSGTAPSPSGKGFLLDDTSLEGQQLQAGTWTPALSIGAGAAVTATVHVRAFVRSSGGVYTQLTSGGVATDIQSSSTVFTNTSMRTISFSGVSFDSVTLSTGDKLYIDVLMEVTSGFTTATANSRRFRMEQNGGAADSIATPGYLASGGLSSSITDTITFSESLTSVSVFPRPISDSITLSESIARTDVLPRAITDTVHFAESLTRTAQAFARPISDSVTLSESIARVDIYSRTVTDTLHFAESLSGSAGKTRPISDALHFAESLTRSIQAFPRSITDTLHFAESLSRTVTDSRSISDTITFSESLSRSRVLPRVLTDSVTLSESLFTGILRTPDEDLPVSFHVQPWNQSLSIGAATVAFKVSDPGLTLQMDEHNVSMVIDGDNF